MRHRILIANNQTEKSPFRGYKTVLRRAIEAVLAHEEFEKKAEISVSLVSEQEIRDLNRNYRSVDRETDVLSFPIWEEGEEDSVAYLGDIVICPSVIFRQAQTFQTTYCQEMCLMVIHSTLHLLGWDHEDEEEKEKMFALQEEILASQNLGTVKTEG